MVQEVAKPARQRVSELMDLGVSVLLGERVSELPVGQGVSPCVSCRRGMDFSKLQESLRYWAWEPFR